MAPFPTPISTCNNNTVFNSLPWLTNHFCWKTNREYSVSTHDCDALYWFGCMYSSCIDSILAWWARIWLYTPELCMTLAPLAPPQTYCAASQTNMIIHKHTNTQIHKYTNTQIHKYTNTQMYCHSVSQYNIQTLPKVQIAKYIQCKESMKSILETYQFSHLDSATPTCQSHKVSQSHSLTVSQSHSLTKLSMCAQSLYTKFNDWWKCWYKMNYTSHHLPLFLWPWLLSTV